MSLFYPKAGAKFVIHSVDPEQPWQAFGHLEQLDVEYPQEFSYGYDGLITPLAGQLKGQIVID